MLVFDRKISRKRLSAFKARTDQRNQDEQKKVDILKAWDRALNSADRDLKIVHCISCRGSTSHIGTAVRTSPFLFSPAGQLLSTWDVISASCIGGKAIRGGQQLGAAPLDIHLNLIVPVQNIIGTHFSDVCFNNFAGLEGNLPGGRVIDKNLLAESILKGRERPNDHGFKMHEPYNILRHPDEFRTRMIKGIGNYNEILLIGRPGVRLYTHFPCTDVIKLKDISFRPNYIVNSMRTGSCNEEFIRKFNEDLEFIKKLLRINGTNKLIFSLGKHPAVQALNLSIHFEAAGFRKQSDLIYILVS